MDLYNPKSPPPAQALRPLKASVMIAIYAPPPRQIEQITAFVKIFQSIVLIGS